MKHLSLTILLTILVFSLGAQTKDQTCHLGITFEISNNPSWGYGEPVVLTVDPFSPADKAGIKTGDIIMEINGGATYLRNYQTIAMWLFNNTTDITHLTIRNIDSYFKDYKLERECRNVNSLSEKDLASSFSFYSLEDINERSFTIPLNIITNPAVDYSDYHTFDFMPVTNAPEVDQYITAELEKTLLAKGLVRDVKDPDFLVQTYYTLQPNPKFTPSSKFNEKNSWRYNVDTQKMVILPILSSENKLSEANGRFILELGIRFFDKKHIDQAKPTQIWDCNVREFLSVKYSLEDYSKLHLPLMMMQFPYAMNKGVAKYIVSFSKYNYTGLHFNMNDMMAITDVDKGSPAFNAGIRPGAIIEKINDFKFTPNKDDLMNGYKRFIIETMVYRDPATRFTDAKGFSDCMFWDTKRYTEVQKAFRKDYFNANFSYLFGFRRYVFNKSDETLQIQAILNKNKRAFRVKPEQRESISLRAL